MKRGFTIIEALISLTVALIAMLSFMSMLGNVRNLQKLEKLRFTVLQELDSWSCRLDAEPFSGKLLSEGEHCHEEGTSGGVVVSWRVQLLSATLKTITLQASLRSIRIKTELARSALLRR